MAKDRLSSLFGLPLPIAIYATEWTNRPFRNGCNRIGLSVMAAINVIRQRQAVHILSDGAFCDATGIVCEIGPNAFALPHLPAALAIRGSTHFMPFLVHRLSRECRSFDDMLGKIVQVALEVHVSFPMAFGTLGYGSIEPDFDIVAVGWSKGRGVPASYLVCSHDRAVAQGLTATAWQLVELPDVLIAPPIRRKADLRCRMGGTPTRPNPFGQMSMGFHCSRSKGCRGVNWT